MTVGEEEMTYVLKRLGLTKVGRNMGCKDYSGHINMNKDKRNNSLMDNEKEGSYRRQHLDSQTLKRTQISTMCSHIT